MAQGFDFFAGGVCLLDFGYFFGGGFVGLPSLRLVLYFLVVVTVFLTGS